MDMKPELIEHRTSRTKQQMESLANANTNSWYYLSITEEERMEQDMANEELEEIAWEEFEPIAWERLEEYASDAADKWPND
jgi:hypothetical protein